MVTVGTLPKMVFAFLCHSVAGTPCRLLYTAVYGDDLQAAANEGLSVDSLRTTRKEQLMQVACRVQTEYGFKMASKDRVPRQKDDTSATSSEEGLLERGLFRLCSCDPFSLPKLVVWLVKDDCAFVFVCELDENQLLAESALAMVTRMVQNHVTSHEQKNAEIMLKAEKMAAILHQFLPNGQLLFLNHKVMGQFEKQLEQLLNKK